MMLLRCVIQSLPRYNLTRSISKVMCQDGGGVSTDVSKPLPSAIVEQFSNRIVFVSLWTRTRTVNMQTVMICGRLSAG